MQEMHFHSPDITQEPRMVGVLLPAPRSRRFYFIRQDSEVTNANLSEDATIGHWAQHVLQQLDPSGNGHVDVDGQVFRLRY